ncbi:hypothetical protein DXK93_01195 [Achromobacter sp. K91]|uniref:Tc toxin subunit A n=1 Tax=Achromobacter sp. K91 TaxID=2292262 RepID=UPI000E664A5C|nr:Tc toxin subunit A [Achromobacter sp. K91]RIJ06131.1 hypothetical protein DXK93_01195 [Achromobacter sp. K91]
MSKATPLIQAVERHCGLADGALSALGYDSVQAIVAVHEHTFVHENTSALGSGDVARNVYRFALAAQKRLLRLYKAFRAGNAAAVKEDGLHYPYSDNPIGNSPAWVEQFPLATLPAAPGDIACDDSPAAYLATLYWWAEYLETYPVGNTAERVLLKARRPDLAKLQINDASVNQIVPKLQLINETLSNFISVNVAELSDIINGAPTTVDQDTLLSRINYPGPAVPYHGPYDKVVSSLTARSTTLSQIVLASGNGMPAFVAQQQAPTTQSLPALLYDTGLDPARLQLALTSYETSGWIDSSGAESEDRVVFFSSNFGMSGPMQYSFPAPEEDLSNVGTLANQTSQSIESILTLFCDSGCNDGNAKSLGSTTVTVTPNVDGSVQGYTAGPKNYGAVIVNAGNSAPVTTAPVEDDAELATKMGMKLVQNVGGSFPPPPSDKCFTQFNQMYRLSHWMRLAPDQLDTLLYAAMQAGGTTTKMEIDTNCMRVLGFYRRWAESYQVSAEDIAAILWQVSPYAVLDAIPQFDRIFNAVPGQQPIKIGGPSSAFDYTAAAYAGLVQSLCAALKITEADFLRLAATVQAAQKLTSNHVTRSLPCLSALYRLTRVASALRLSVSDMFDLLDRMPDGDALTSQLAGVQPKLSLLATTAPLIPTTRDVLDQLDALAALREFVRGHGLTPGAAAALIAPSAANGFPVPASTAAHLAVVTNATRLIPGSLFDMNILPSLGLPVQDTSSPPVKVDWASVVANSKIVGDPSTPQSGLIAIETEADRESAIQKALPTGCNLTSTDYQPLLDSLSAAQQRQYGVTDGVLGEALGLPTDTLHMLMQAFESNGSYTFLSGCQTFLTAHASPEPADLKGSALMTQFNTLAHQAMLVRHCALTPASLQALTNPSWFNLDSTAGDWWMLTLKSLYALDCYEAWKKRAGSEDDVTQYLQMANQEHAVAADAKSELARQLGISSDEMQGWINWVTGDATGATIVTKTTQVGSILALMAVAEQTGLTLKQMLALAALPTTQAQWATSATSDAALIQWQYAAAGAMATLNYVPESAAAAQ